MLGSNMKFTLTPIWTVKGDPSSSIDITLSLFNDTLDHALMNFLFVNTLIPNNMSLQYAVFRLPPCAYDIKIEGGKRLMMCSGKFTCMNRGVVRRPSDKFFKNLNPYINKQKIYGNKLKVETLKERNFIRIPDVYEVKMTFESLLPDVFNTYMLGFATENQMVNPQGAIDITRTAWYNSDKPKNVLKNLQSEAENGSNDPKGPKGCFEKGREDAKKNINKNNRIPMVKNSNSQTETMSVEDI
jgi:hypothetical protein